MYVLISRVHRSGVAVKEQDGIGRGIPPWPRAIGKLVPYVDVANPDNLI
jgi:hypothetical protein